MNASVQRALRYRKQNEDHTEFAVSVMTFLNDALLPDYIGQGSCDEKQHFKNIDRLIVRAESTGACVLENGYPYGVAQKLLNLQLKYAWCLSTISESPHCPIDRIIINLTSYRGKLAWTQMNKDQYTAVIKDIKRLAGAENLTPSFWELLHYNLRAARN